MSLQDAWPSKTAQINPYVIGGCEDDEYVMVLASSCKSLQEVWVIIYEILNDSLGLRYKVKRDSLSGAVLDYKVDC
jgi:hypothetical protein